MKTIINKTFASLNNGPVTTTSSLLKESLNFPPQGGFDFDTMRKRNRVAVAIEKAKDGEIELEDADFETAVVAIKAVKWSVNAPHLLEFGEQFGL